jgi:DNA repair protein RecO (recombination protein O)
VQPEARYAYLPERGPLALADAAPGEADTDFTVSGRTLLDMSHGDFTRQETRDEARRLMRRLIAARLSGQTLHTSDMLRELQDL